MRPNSILTEDSRSAAGFKGEKRALANQSRFARCIVLTVLIILIRVPLASAQAGGSLAGTVKDSSLRIRRQDFAGRRMDRVRVGPVRPVRGVRAGLSRSLARPEVSLDGGSAPRWAASGRELFYRKDNKMMAVNVSTISQLILVQNWFEELKARMGSREP